MVSPAPGKYAWVGLFSSLMSQGWGHADIHNLFDFYANISKNILHFYVGIFYFTNAGSPYKFKHDKSSIFVFAILKLFK